MFLFLLLLRVFDDADQLLVLGIFERSFDRDEALGVFIVDPVTSRTASLARLRVSFPRSTALCERLPRMLDRQWAP